MINKQFGIYLVLEKDTELSKLKKRVYWKCQCQKCGNIISVRDDGVKRNPQSCPNCKNDLTGQKFGKLTVLYKTKIDKNGHSYWMCQCECGNQKEISSSNLKSNSTQSCGCLHSQIASNKTIDLTGQKFGKLTVLKRISSTGEEKIKWLCKCECGTETIIDGTNLKTGHTTSCGCIRSKGELKIKQLLNNLNIQFQTEYIFQDLPQRRFDFYLPQLNICIEYDGKQHYDYVNTWHKTIENFNQSIERDKEKNQYCLIHNIPLIRISYTDYDELNENYILNILRMEEAQDEV